MIQCQKEDVWLQGYWVPMRWDPKEKWGGRYLVVRKTNIFWACCTPGPGRARVRHAGPGLPFPQPRTASCTRHLQVPTPKFQPPWSIL